MGRRMEIEQKSPKSARQLAESLSQDHSRVSSSLNRIAKKCAREFASKMVVATMLDDKRQYFIAKFGIEGQGNSRDVSFCRHAIAEKAPLLVADASKDGRFQDNPLVTGEPYIRSYLGVPIADTHGRLIGTLCLIDDQPNHFSSEDIEALSLYAQGVEDMLRLHNLHLKATELTCKVQEQNELLKENNRIFREAEHVAQLGAWELNIETGCLSCTDGIYAIFETASGTPISLEGIIDCHGESFSQKIRASISRAIETGERFEVEGSFLAPSGKRKFFRSIGEVTNRGESLPARIIGITKDITESHQSEVALRHAAEHDSLTQLYNRYAFDQLLRDRISQVKNADENVSLLMIDLDGFKEVNDTLGHVIGDILLEDTGQRIARAVPQGTIAARWGGDEFAIILPQSCDRDQALAVGNLVLRAIGQRTAISGHLIDVNATAGLAHVASDVGGKELVRRADTALFHGKRIESGRVHVYSPAIEKQNFARRQAISEVRSAISENRLFAGYQPVIDLPSGRIIGYEALMRLNTRSGRKLTATEVFPALLDPALSREISGSMLNNVSTEIAKLRDIQPELDFVSINASEADLLSEGFVKRFAAKMVQAGVDLSFITLEVTETILLVSNSEPVREVLLDLRSRGVRIALDDFGTGYSSLSHLREFPIDKVKIDGSFVRGLTEEHQSRAIVRALIGMAMSMNIEVIAEGVETQAQCDLLGQMGCQFGQGFLFGAAQDVSRLELNRLENPKDCKRIASAA